jgi:hypothetical protein
MTIQRLEIHLALSQEIFFDRGVGNRIALIPSATS